MRAMTIRLLDVNLYNLGLDNGCFYRTFKAQSNGRKVGKLNCIRLANVDATVTLSRQLQDGTEFSNDNLVRAWCAEYRGNIYNSEVEGHITQFIKGLRI